MVDNTHDKDSFFVPDKISKIDKAFITGEWLETINKSKSLEISQQSLLDLLRKENKSDSDIIVLKAFIKAEKFNYDKLNASRILAEKMDKDFISVFKKAISDKKMLTADLSYKQAMQKMIDDKVITNADLYTEFLKSAPAPEIKNRVADEVASTQIVKNPSPDDLINFVKVDTTP